MLAILLLFGSVVAGLVGSGESVQSKWPVLTLAVTSAFILVVTTILEVLASEPTKFIVRPWYWLLIPVDGPLLGVAIGLADSDPGFRQGFVFGLAVGTIASVWVLLAITVPPAVRRFAKPA